MNLLSSIKWELLLLHFLHDRVDSFFLPQIFGKKVGAKERERKKKTISALVTGSPFHP